jgi:two-component system chemotaxis response regulator CheB
VIGVILSGMLDDGAVGLRTVKQHGGVAIVQDPSEALYPDMPHYAMDHAAVDYVLPLDQMAEMLKKAHHDIGSQTEGGHSVRKLD